MESSQMQHCEKCGSSDLTRRGSGYRCWGCGTLVNIRASSAPSERPEPPETLLEEARRSFGTIVPPPGSPVEIPETEIFTVPVSLPKSKGAAIIQKTLQSIFRPIDIRRAEFAPLTLFYVPLWRIDTAVEGFHLGLQHSTGPQGKVHWVLPSGGFRHRDEVIILPARRFFPIDPTRYNHINTPLRSLRHLDIRYDEMVPDADFTIDEGEVIAPDITVDDAAREAAERLRRKVQPTTALYARFEARVRSAVLCRYPLWVLRYRYDGEANRSGGLEECHIAVSGRTGKVLSARHPSVFWSLVSKMRRWFSSEDEQ